MTIALNEIKDLREYIEGKNFDDFICDVEENSDDYENILEEITTDIKHVVSEYLRNAIECGFDKEIMEQDFNIPEEFIEILSQYKNNKIEISY